MKKANAKPGKAPVKKAPPPIATPKVEEIIIPPKEIVALPDCVYVDTDYIIQETFSCLFESVYTKAWENTIIHKKQPFSIAATLIHFH